ncbi:MAG: hypothetical protein CMH54_10300 [Myxococcales bacterium]|nr:hypothetical protein [Myxococcales bacterium]|tara:strand:+ start:256 stop:693 length:438 start_codon:yes stop_codon:yes gene_type:complete
MGLRRNRYFTRALLAAICLSTLWLSGCSRPGVDLVDESLILLEEAIVVLEKHKDNPVDAIAAFRRFVIRNESRVRALEVKAQTVLRRTTKKDRTMLRRRFQEGARALEQRCTRLAGIYGEHPEVLKDLERLASILSAGESGAGAL